MKRLVPLLLLISIPAMAAKVATVKLVRGEAHVVTTGKTLPLKLDDMVEEGAVIKTAEKSFVKLIFVDKSSMNVGPNSEMKIEQFNGKEAGVIDVVKGQIRSQVTKDYLQIQDPNKSKLFMKTKNAVMGVRGTDFMITTNGINTATVLFEGEVVFNSLPQQGQIPTAKLDDIVDRGVKVMPGEFSVVQAGNHMPTVPSVMNLQQREVLEKNTEFAAPAATNNTRSEAAAPAKSVVPEGLSGEAVSNSSDNLKAEVAQASDGKAPAAPAAAPAAPAANAAGYIDGDKVKPANGSFVHLETGTVVPPPAGSVLDPNTNSYIPAPGNGTVGANGEYVPPADIVINEKGEFFKVIPTEATEVAKTESDSDSKEGESSETSEKKTASSDSSAEEGGESEAPAERKPASVTAAPKLVQIAPPSVLANSAPLSPREPAGGPVIQPSGPTSMPLPPVTVFKPSDPLPVAPPGSGQPTSINLPTSGTLNIEVIK